MPLVTAAQPRRYYTSADPQLMTLAEVLAFLRVSRRTLNRHIRLGEFPRGFKYINARTAKRYFYRSEVEAWLIERATAPRDPVTK